MGSRTTRLTATLAAAFGCLVLGAVDAQAGANGRERLQRVRIEQGVGDGSLTRGEARRLGREQVRIERAERRFRADDGHLGPRERAQLDRRLDRASHHIHRARHNERER
jgi:hypothetical protein